MRRRDELDEEPNEEWQRDMAELKRYGAHVMV